MPSNFFPAKMLRLKLEGGVAIDTMLSNLESVASEATINPENVASETGTSNVEGVATDAMPNNLEIVASKARPLGSVASGAAPSNLKINLETVVSDARPSKQESVTSYAGPSNLESVTIEVGQSNLGSIANEPEPSNLQATEAGPSNLESSKSKGVASEEGPISLASDDTKVTKFSIQIGDDDHCIHKVPWNLRKVREEAYSPQLISIGPYHHGKKELADMENHKMRYAVDFVQRLKVDKWIEIQGFVQFQVKGIERYYAEAFEPIDELAHMILHDAVFIIELFLRFFLKNKADYLLNELWLGTIRRDLLLLENQLPYILLESLYKLAFDDRTGEYSNLPDFHTLSCKFFGLKRQDHEQRYVKINHFTDLVRYDLVGILENRWRNRPRDSLPNAVKLKKSGVKFKSRESKYLGDIILRNRENPTRLNNSVELEIPCIEITHNTECFFRNLMALEQCQYPSEVYVCSYIDLMDSLIDTENDVDLLVEEGIIYNPRGDNFAIADMFNKLQLQIPPSQISYYSTIHEKLRDHYKSNWNHAVATLKSVYFSNPWRSTATVVAFILLVLTLIQTIFSILQVVWPT